MESEGPMTQSVLDYELQQLGILRTTHNPLDENSSGSSMIITSPSDAYDKIPVEKFENNSVEDIDNFITNTDFNSDVLLYILSKWPKSNGAYINGGELRRVGDKITGEFVADGESRNAGDDAPIFPGCLSRVYVDRDNIKNIFITITSGRGVEETTKESL